MRRCDLTDRIGREALELHRGRLICRLLRKEGLLADNTSLVLRLADHLLRSYSYRASNSK